MYSQEFLDFIAVASFWIGILNYDENLSQSDKDDMMNQTSATMEAMLNRLEDDLEEQNQMLREILDSLHRLEERHDPGIPS